MKPTSGGTVSAGTHHGLYRGLFDSVPVSIWEEDASEVKVYLDALAQSGVKDVRTYFDYHPEEVARCAAMVKVLSVNPATVKLYEAADAAALLANIDKVLCEESYDVLKRTLIAIAGSETEFEADAFNRTLAGNKKHFLMKWFVAPGYEETYGRVWIFMTDLTEHEMVAGELDDAVRRYRTLTLYIKDVIWTMDMGLNFTFISPSVEKMLGYSPGEISGMHYEDLLTPASLEVVMAAVAEELAPEAMRTRDPHRSRVLELEFLTKGRSRLWGELYISFMLDSKCMPAGIVGVIRDITERRTARKALEHTWQAQKTINELLQISLEDISTDEMLKQMISTVVGMPWFSPHASGGILLMDPGTNTLVMKADSGLTGESLRACARRKIGECLCGSAAASGELVYCTGEGGPGERRCQMEAARSQYCVPFNSSGRPLGVLNLYLEAGRGLNDKEMEFLMAVGRILAGSIERKEASKTLRRSEANYRAIFDKASDSIFIHDAETACILDVNQKTCELFGYSHEEMLSLGVADISGGDRDVTAEAALARVKTAARKGSELFEWLCKDRSGRLFWAEVNLSVGRFGSAERVVAFVRDIDARKRAEQSVLGLSRFLEGIMDAVDIWISACDRDGNVLVWNRAAESISGYPRQEVLGHNRIRSLLYPEGSLPEGSLDAPCAERCLEHLKGGRSCDRCRTAITTRGGDLKPMRWNCYGLSDDEGNLCGIVTLACASGTGPEPGLGEIQQQILKVLKQRSS